MTITSSLTAHPDDTIGISLENLSIADAHSLLRTSKKMEATARELFPQIDEIYATLRSLPESYARQVAKQYTYVSFLPAKDSIFANKALFQVWPELRACLLDPTRYKPRGEIPPQEEIPTLPSETADPSQIRHWLNNPKNQVHLGKVKMIYLTNLGLQELPQELRRFKNLKKLNISSNELKTVPLWLKKFKKLYHLILDRNPIPKLPKNLLLLNVKILSMQNITLLTTFPKAVSQFEKLEELDLRGCPNIQKFPNRFLPHASLKRVDAPEKLKNEEAKNWFQYLEDAISFTIDIDDNYGFTREEAFQPRDAPL